MKIKNFLKEWWHIFLAVIVLGYTYFHVSDHEQITADLAGGLFVEVLGAILTFILIDRVIRGSEERKRVRMERAALRSFRFTISDLLNMFWDMRRAAAKEKLYTPPANWREAIASDAAIDDIQHLDILSDRGITPPMAWNKYLSQNFQNLHLPSIRRLIDSYSTFLSEGLVEKLEALNSSELFSRFFLQIGNLPSTLPGGVKQIPTLAIMGDFLKSAIINLLDLLDVYNASCPEKVIEFNGLDLSEKHGPLLGTGRVEYVCTGPNQMDLP